MNAHPDQTLFLPMTRSMRMRIEATIEQLVALLDEIDGDPDLEAANDDEPSLGWTYCMDRPVIKSRGSDDDRELEDEHDEDGGDSEPDSDDEPDADDEPSDLL